jgi:multiple sugar transport system permease protein
MTVHPDVPHGGRLPLHLLQGLGLLDTRGLMCCTYSSTYLRTFLCGFFNEVPKEVEQAAMIDATVAEIFRKIVFLCQAGLAVTSVFCLIWMWNEFFFAFLFRTSRAPSTC